MLMKKIFTFAIAMMACVAMMAQPASLCVKDAAKARGLFTGVSMGASLSGNASKAPVYPTGEYKSLGMGVMVDDMITDLLEYQPVSYEVEIQQSVDDPNFYRVMAPYGPAFAQAMADVNNVELKDTEYDKDSKCYIDICATDPEDVYFPVTETGVTVEAFGALKIGINSSYNVTLKDGIFSAPMMAIAVAFEGSDGNLSAYAMNRHGKFLIALPGVNPFDYTVQLQDMPNCVTSRNITGTLKHGADLAGLKYHVVPDWQEDEIMSAVKEIAQYGNDWNYDDSFSYSMAMTGKETLIVVGVDASGNAVGYDWCTYYYIDDDPEGWEDCGTAVWHEGMLQEFFNIEPQAVQCTLQRSKDRPQYLRLVNPMAAHTHFSQYGHKGHNHYIYINAEDPECVYMEESPVGFDFNYGMVRFSSDVNYYLGAGFTLDDCKELELGCTLADGKLTFPDEGLLFSMLGYSGGDWYTIADPSQTFVEMPEGFSFSGAQDIVADGDNAPAQYYNLQGMRIAAPQAGQLVIERRGNTARKILVR